MANPLRKIRLTAKSGVKPPISLLLTSLVLGFCVGIVLILITPRANLQVPERHASTTSSSTIVSQPTVSLAPRGYFDATLYNQGMAHDQFHLRTVKRRLAAMVQRFNRIAIVGVEGGHDVLDLSKQGYEIHAFEPMSNYVDNLRKWVGPNVHIYRVAATNISTGTMKAAYLTGSIRRFEKAKNARVDDYVKGGLDVLSADIQGGEWDVVQGAMGIIRGAGVRSMWIEIHPCNPKLPPMLETLDKLGYALFDMVPIGGTYERKGRESMHDVPKAASLGWFTRPSKFEDYIEWFCQTKDDAWSWLQTDILAIRRDLITNEMMLKLKNLSNDVLGEVTAGKRL